MKVVILKQGADRKLIKEFKKHDVVIGTSNYVLDCAILFSISQTAFGPNRWDVSQCQVCPGATLSPTNENT